MKSRQECIPVGCVPSAVVAVSGGGQEGLPRGVYDRGESAPMHAGIHPPPVNRIADRQV